MSFIKKIWKDRISEYPTRRNLEKSDGSSELVTVSRSEGNISQEGDAFSAENMNDLEERISNEFEALNTNITNKFQAPDYTNKQVISSNTYTVTEDGYVALYVHKGNNGVFQSATYRGTLTINGTVVWYYSNTISSNEIRIYPAIRSGLYPVKAGDTVKFSVTNADSYERAFFPAR
jgi:hypothetical protein